MKKLIFRNFSTIMQMKNKFTVQDVKYYLDSLLNMKMELDHLPDHLYDFKDDINELMFHPGAKAGNACCDSGCINCVNNTLESDIEKFEELIRDLVVRINHNI